MDTTDTHRTCQHLIGMCVMGAWDNKARQVAWLAKEMAAYGIDAAAFDREATLWAQRHKNPHPQLCGPSLRGVA